MKIAFGVDPGGFCLREGVLAHLKEKGWEVSDLGTQDMQLFSVNPKIHLFDTFTQFAGEFSLGEDDLVFTEAVIYNHYIEKLCLPCHIVIRDKYETGEPSEEAIDAILRDLKDISYRRMIAVGGGSVMARQTVLRLTATPVCRSASRIQSTP